MTLTVNGEPRTVEDGATVLTLLETLAVQPEATVVQCNDDIIAREDFADTVLAEGDRVELVRFVGGG